MKKLEQNPDAIKPAQNVRQVRYGLRTKFLLAFAIVFTGYAAFSSSYLLRYFFDDKARYVLFSLHQGTESMCAKMAGKPATEPELLSQLQQFDSASGFVFENSTGRLLSEHGAKEISALNSASLWALVKKYSDDDKLANFTTEHRDSNLRLFLSACRIQSATSNSMWLLFVADADQALRPAVLLLSKMGMMFLLLLLTGFTVFWFMARSLTKPLGQLAAIVDDLGAGNYKKIIEIKNQDELGVLADSFSILSSRLEAREAELEKTTELANQDFLTGLWNKRYLDRRTQEHFILSKRHSHDLSLIYLDADHFKKINDTFGHASGDEVLKDFSALLKSRLRITDFVARVGGEEFVMVLPETNLEGAIVAAQKLRNLINEHRFLGEKQHKMSASLGVASIGSSDAANASELIAIADKYAYQSKTDGRDRITSVKGTAL